MPRDCGAIDGDGKMAAGKRCPLLAYLRALRNWYFTKHAACGWLRFPRWTAYPHDSSQRSRMGFGGCWPRRPRLPTTVAVVSRMTRAPAAWCNSVVFQIMLKSCQRLRCTRCAIAPPLLRQTRAAPQTVTGMAGSAVAAAISRRIPTVGGSAIQPVRPLMSPKANGLQRAPPRGRVVAMPFVILTVKITCCVRATASCRRVRGRGEIAQVEAWCVNCSWSAHANSPST